MQGRSNTRVLMQKCLGDREHVSRMYCSVSSCKDVCSCGDTKNERLFLEHVHRCVCICMYFLFLTVSGIMLRRFYPGAQHRCAELTGHLLLIPKGLAAAAMCRKDKFWFSICLSHLHQGNDLETVPVILWKGWWASRTRGSTFHQCWVKWREDALLPQRQHGCSSRPVSSLHRQHEAMQTSALGAECSGETAVHPLLFAGSQMGREAFRAIFPYAFHDQRPLFLRAGRGRSVGPGQCSVLSLCDCQRKQCPRAQSHSTFGSLDLLCFMRSRPCERGLPEASQQCSPSGGAVWRQGLLLPAAQPGTGPVCDPSSWRWVLSSGRSKNQCW